MQVCLHTCAEQAGTGAAQCACMARGKAWPWSLFGFSCCAVLAAAAQTQSVGLAFRQHWACPTAPTCWLQVLFTRELRRRLGTDSPVQVRLLKTTDWRSVRVFGWLLFLSWPMGAHFPGLVKLLCWRDSQHHGTSAPGLLLLCACVKLRCLHCTLAWC